MRQRIYQLPRSSRARRSRQVAARHARGDALSGRAAAGGKVAGRVAAGQVRTGIPVRLLRADVVPGEACSRCQACRAGRSALGRPGPIRLLLLAWAVCYAGDLAAFTVASVYAYRAGGAGLVGVLGLAKGVPAGLLVPLVTSWSDRVRRERLLIASVACRALLLAAAATAMTGGGQEQRPRSRPPGPGLPAGGDVGRELPEVPGRPDRCRR